MSVPGKPKNDLASGDITSGNSADTNHVSRLKEESIEDSSTAAEAASLSQQTTGHRSTDPQWCETSQAEPSTIDSETPSLFSESPDTQSPQRRKNLSYEVLVANQKLGPYRLLRPLGQGGMGAVWLAEQEEPVRRQVALKVIRTDSQSQQILSRFTWERQALAVMQHGNIAKILDAGQTETGLPYFAMDWVDGPTIVKYCARQRLNVEERLELFLAVCDAVQHAHQKAIIHRDLKPNNILVAEEDGKAVPKVIDFGLAKAVDGARAEEDEQTQTGQVLGTVRYMSPEQASIPPVDIDTRSDIYSLGAVLYELLIGVPPLDLSTIHGRQRARVLDLIREVEPLRPSQRVLSEGDVADRVAKFYPAGSGELVSVLQGELDWIVMKALEKDRSRRYPSVASLSDDLRRFLNHEPIEARPPSNVYRVKKFLVRNRGIATAASLILMTLILGLMGTSWGYWRASIAENQAQQQKMVAVEARKSEKRRAEREQESRQVAEQRAEQLETAFSMLQAIFRDLDVEAAAEDRYLPWDVRIAGRLNRVMGDLEKIGLQEDPLRFGSLKIQVGETLLAVGDWDSALETLESARQVLQQHLGEGSPEVVTADRIIAEAKLKSGAVSVAIGELEKLLPRAERVDTDLAMEVRNTLGAGYLTAGDFQQAVPQLESVVAWSRQRDDHQEHGPTFLNNLAAAYEEAGQLAAATEVLEEAAVVVEAHWGEEHLRTWVFRRRLATSTEKPLPELRQIAAGMAELVGSEHPETLATRELIATFLFRTGEFEESLREFRSVIEAEKRVLGAGHPQTLKDMLQFADALRSLNHSDEARKLLSEVHELTSIYGTTFPVRIKALRISIPLEMDHGNFAKARELAGEGYRQCKKLKGPFHNDTLQLRIHELDALARLGQLSEAKQEILTVRDQCLEHLGPHHEVTLNAINEVVVLLVEEGRLAEAETECRALLAAYLEQLSELSTSVAKTHLALGSILLEQQQYDSAREEIELALTANRSIWGEVHPMVLRCRITLATIQLNLGERQAAIENLRECQELADKHLGEDHIVALLAAHNRASIFLQLDLPQEALPLLEEVVKRQTRVMGPANPETLVSLNNLAGAHHELGNVERSVQLLETGWKEGKLANGAGHPTTQMLLRNFARGLVTLGKHRDAIAPWKELADLAADRNGLNHRSTNEALTKLTYCYYITDQPELAIPILQQRLHPGRSWRIWQRIGMA